MGGTLLLAVVVSAGIFFAWLARHRSADELWKTTAAQLGLAYTRHGRSGYREMAGALAGHEVVIEVVPNGDGSLLEARVKGDFDPELRLSPESAFKGVFEALGSSDVQVDDQAFDDAVHVAGPEDVLLAALDKRARAAVLRLVALRGRVEDGDVRFTTPHLVHDPSDIGPVLRSMLEAAGALAVPSVAKALQLNAQHERDPAVRLRNLEVLCRHHPDAPESREALRAALGDEAAVNRLFAAKAIGKGPEVQAALEKLFDAPEELSAAQRAEVLGMLVDRFPYDAEAERVAKALDSNDGPCRAVAVAAAGTAQDGALLLSHPALASTRDEGVGVALASALQRAAGVAGEPMLLELSKSESPRVAAAAAKALGSVGTVRAVEPLLPLTQGVLTAPLVKEAARDAVRAIQARLGDAAAGRLSVVDAGPEEGALSLERDRRGVKS